MGFLTAGIVLAIMVTPYIISVRVSAAFCPRDQREAALSLAPRTGNQLEGRRTLARAASWAPFSWPSRAPRRNHGLTMVIGNAPVISARSSARLFIAAIIANELTEATAICIINPYELDSYSFF